MSGLLDLGMGTLLHTGASKGVFHPILLADELIGFVSLQYPLVFVEQGLGGSGIIPYSDYDGPLLIGCF